MRTESLAYSPPANQVLSGGEPDSPSSPGGHGKMERVLRNGPWWVFENVRDGVGMEIPGLMLLC